MGRGGGQDLLAFVRAELEWWGRALQWFHIQTFSDSTISGPSHLLVDLNLGLLQVSVKP